MLLPTSIVMLLCCDQVPLLLKTTLAPALCFFLVLQPKSVTKVRCSGRTQSTCQNQSLSQQPPLSASAIFSLLMVKKALIKSVTFLKTVFKAWCLYHLCRPGNPQSFSETGQVVVHYSIHYKLSSAWCCQTSSSSVVDHEPGLRSWLLQNQVDSNNNDDFVMADVTEAFSTFLKCMRFQCNCVESSKLTLMSGVRSVITLTS